MDTPDKAQANGLSAEEQLFQETWNMLLDETERSVERYLAMLAELRAAR